MARLIITRKSEFVNALRDYRIYLNGKEIGTISNGETEEFVIPEGTNTLIAKIDWCGSQELKINVSNEETKSLSISGFRPGLFFLFFISFTIVIPILFREFIRFHYFLKYLFLLLSIIGLVAVIYYLTIGRNKYLEIKEIPTKKE